MFVAFSSNQYQVTTKCLSFDHVVTLRDTFIRYYRALLDVNYFVPSSIATKPRLRPELHCHGDPLIDIGYLGTRFHCCIKHFFPCIEKIENVMPKITTMDGGAKT